MNGSSTDSRALTSRRVVVTGAGRGIGLGVVKALLARGAGVAVAELDRIDRLRDELETSADPDRVYAASCDVTDGDAFERFLAAAEARIGPINGLVNNAGVIRMGPALDATADEWETQFQVNVAAVISCSQRFARRLSSSNREGAIVNIASNAGKVGYPNMAGYNASKAAVINLTRTLAAEWAAIGINVNAVCPGGVKTPMLEHVAEHIAASTGHDAGALFESMVPSQLGRHILPEEVGAVVAFLLSDDARIIRGQSVNVDGGDTPY